VSVERASNSAVLAVMPAEDDLAALREILADSGRRLHTTTVVTDVALLLSNSPTGAVISEGAFPDGHDWKDLLSVLHEAVDPPALIVADRLADERLWAEVLNLGGYDLLAKPFDTKEVLYAVGAACRWWENKPRTAILLERGVASAA